MLSNFLELVLVRRAQMGPVRIVQSLIEVGESETLGVADGGSCSTADPPNSQSANWHPWFRFLWQAVSKKK